MKRASALAAENRAMSEALADCEWIRGMFGKMTGPELVIDEWRQRPRKHGLLAARPTRELSHQ
eukprot:8542559-Alexandrium_andersonii.AAC.1